MGKIMILLLFTVIVVKISRRERKVASHSLRISTIIYAIKWIIQTVPGELIGTWSLSTPIAGITSALTTSRESSLGLVKSWFGVSRRIFWGE